MAKKKSNGVKKTKKTNGVKTPDKAIELRKGYIVTGTPSATGGHSYKQEEISPPTHRNTNRRRVWKTTKITDNVEACDAVDKVRQRGHYLLRRLCAATEIGYFLEPDNYAKFITAARELGAAADAVNALARKMGSTRQVHINFVPLPIDLATPNVAAEVAYTVRTRLAEMRDLIHAGVVNSVLDSKIQTNQNLHRLGIGFAETVVLDAIKEIKEARSRIKTKIKAHQTPESAGKQEKLLAVKAAISWFSPVTERTESDEVPEVAAEEDVPNEMTL